MELPGGVLKAIIFIDDGIATCRGFEIGKSVSELVRNDLLFAGFVINNKKICFNPKTKEKYLGTITDTRELTFTVPQEKMTNLLENVTMYLNQEFLTPKQLSKIAGQLSSTHLVIGSLVGFLTTNTYHFIKKRISWYQKKIINKNVKEELNL